MDSLPFGSLALILLVGTLCQWVSWRLKVPAIPLLLVTGFLLGPVSGMLNPDEVMGKHLFAIVEGAVAIILFEGGLTLRWRELRSARQSIIRLTTLGVVATFILATLGARFFLDFEWYLAALLGALLTITGPTVVIPMLRTIKPRGRVKYVAKWEGILNDPIGVVLALLVFEMHLADSDRMDEVLLIGIVQTLVVSLSLCALTYLLIYQVLRRKWLPDYLHNPLTLALVLTVFGTSNTLQPESGLLTVTLLGILLTNTRSIDIRQIVEFKENLQVLLISFLFIILSARVDTKAIELIGFSSLGFLIFLIVVVRPLAVLVGTAGSKVSWPERGLLMMLAPRGIVAVALVSVFALKLDEKAGDGDDLAGQQLLAEMLVVVVGTVLFYGALAGWAAARLKLSNLSPQGLLILGAHDWARDIAKALREAEIIVTLIDSNQHNIFVSKQEELNAARGNIFSEDFLDSLDLSEIGTAALLTGNDEINAAARGALGDFMERGDIYHLVPYAKEDNPYRQDVKALNPLFSEHATFDRLQERFHAGERLHTLEIEDEASFQRLVDLRGDSASHNPWLLFLVEEDGKLRVFSPRTGIRFRKPGKVILLAKPDFDPENPSKALQNELATDATS
ncbi:MAG: cation:proton antiporter [Opitutales bacterium]